MLSRGEGLVTRQCGHYWLSSGGGRREIWRYLEEPSGTLAGEYLLCIIIIVPVQLN